ncbi:hypothetical protein LTR95_001131 [Oleoguttula sp. CCFEE 5521]
MKAAETGLERADDGEGQEAEHERIYLFFQKRYGGDSSSLHTWQLGWKEVEVEIESSVDQCQATGLRLHLPCRRCGGGGDKVEQCSTSDTPWLSIKARHYPLKAAKGYLIKGTTEWEGSQGLAASAKALQMADGAIARLADTWVRLM